MNNYLKERLLFMYKLQKECPRFASEWETAESIVMPFLYAIGWKCAIMRSSNIDLIRTGASKDFDILYVNRQKKKIYMGIECKRFGIRRSDTKNVCKNPQKTTPSNDSFSEQIIRYKTDSNIVCSDKYRFVPQVKIVWTTGRDWVVFKEPVFWRDTKQRQAISNSFVSGGGDDFDNNFGQFVFGDDMSRWDSEFERLREALSPDGIIETTR